MLTPVPGKQQRKRGRLPGESTAVRSRSVSTNCLSSQAANAWCPRSCQNLTGVRQPTAFRSGNRTQTLGVATGDPPLTVFPAYLPSRVNFSARPSIFRSVFDPVESSLTISTTNLSTDHRFLGLLAQIKTLSCGSGFMGRQSVWSVQDRVRGQSPLIPLFQSGFIVYLATNRIAGMRERDADQSLPLVGVVHPVEPFLDGPPVEIHRVAGGRIVPNHGSGVSRARVSRSSPFPRAAPTSPAASSDT